MYDDGVEDDDYTVTGCDPEEYEDDYEQPSEMDEWLDFDPDC